MSFILHRNQLHNLHLYFHSHNHILSEIEQAEIRLRLEKAKNKRLENQKIQGDDLSSSEALSAADWVKRSRVVERDRAKLDAEKAAKKMQDEEEERLRNMSSYSAASLSGLAVKHSAKDFEAGQEIILTLADSNILETDERGRTVDLNNEGDVLENVNMTDEDRRLEREKRNKRLKQAVYSGYDDDEFAEGVKVRFWLCLTNCVLRFFTTTYYCSFSP